MLSVLVGSGVQVLGMVIVTMIFAVLGFLSPANRGGLMTAGVILFVVMGCVFRRRVFRFHSWLPADDVDVSACSPATSRPGPTSCSRARPGSRTPLWYVLYRCSPSLPLVCLCFCL